MALYKEIKLTFLQIHKSRKIIYELAKKDLQVRYLGSYLGFLWAFIQPIISILLYWFVFQVGFKSRPVGDIPFILWLVPAMISWNFFSDGLTSATNSIVDNSYLVKKVVFPVGILPVIKILSSLFIHAFFILFMIVMLLIYGYKLTWYDFQTFYYLIAMITLLFGLSQITSSLVVFFKDVGQFVVLILQFGFWLTPIFWSINMIPEKYHWIVKINPMYYIVQGYRDSFVYRTWFWSNAHMTLYFWTVTLFVILTGTFLIHKLKPHFADVL